MGTKPLDPAIEQLVNENMGLARRLATSTKCRLNFVDHSECLSVAMASVWECAVLFAGKNKSQLEFEKMAKRIYRFRTINHLRKHKGRSERSRQRKGKGIGMVDIDAETEQGTLSDVIPSGDFVEHGCRIEDIADEFEFCGLKKNEKVVCRMMLVDGETGTTTAAALGVTPTRIGQIKVSVIRKLRKYFTNKNEF